MSFTDKKEDLIKYTKDLINCLETISSIEDIITKYDKILKQVRMKNANYDVQSIIENLKNNLSSVERSTMKCVFIGHTSNGKSCIINAILKQKILPSDAGRTTSCFINIMGYEGHEINLKDKHGKKCPVVDLQSLGNQLSDQTCSVDSLLRVFIPRNMCELLKNDVEIIDCPGADYDPYHDKAIIKNCKDSDVFVFVLHAESTLTISDRELFKKLKGHLSNVIIVVNKWDLVASSQSNDRIRRQHQDEIVKFLVEDLAMYSLSDAQERIFFISSLNEVKKIESDNNLSIEFNLFKDALTKDSNEHAIEFKIKKFHKEAQQQKNLTLDFLSDLPNFIVKLKAYDYNTMKEQIMIKSKNKISEIFKNIEEESKKLLDDIVLRSNSTIIEAMKTVVIDDKFMTTVEDNLVLSLSECFENNMKSLPHQIKDISIQYSCIDTHGDKMERFSKLCTDLDKSIKEYKEHIENNIKHLSLELKKEFQNKKNKKNFVSNVVTTLVVSIFTIDACLTVKKLFTEKEEDKKHVSFYRPFQNFSAEDYLSLTPESLAKKATDLIMKYQTKSDVNIFFSCSIEMYLQKFHCSIDNIVKDCLNEFIEDQRNMNDLLITFDNLRVKIENVPI